MRILALVTLIACSSPARPGADEPAPGGAVDAAPRVATPPPPPPRRVDAPPPPPPEPLPLDRDPPTLAARVVELYQAIGAALAAAGTDCKRAVTGLTAVRERFRDVRAAVGRMVAENRAAPLEAELERRREPIAAALARMQPTLDACRADVKLNDALDLMAGGG